MRIEWTPPLRRAAARRDGKTDAAREPFSATLDGGTAPAPTAPPPTVGPVSGLLTVQEVPDEPGRRRRAVQRGDDLLDRLDELRAGLLAGILSRYRLGQLVQLAQTARETVDDARLAALLDEIDLRVAVELAKLDAEL